MFAVESIVRYKGEPSHSAKAGALAVVTGVSEQYISVCWLDELANGQSNGHYYPRSFEFVDSMRCWCPSKVEYRATPEENLRVLERTVDGLRAQGYTVEARVTEPPVPPVVLKF